MEDNDKVTCNRPFEEIDGSNGKTASLEMLVEHHDSEAKKYVVMPKHRGRPRKRKLEIRSQPLIRKTFDNAMTDRRSELRKDRFRPIRPKPISSSAVLVPKNKLLEMSPTLNIPTLMSNRFVFTTPLLERNKAAHVSTLLDVERKSNRVIKLDDDDQAHVENGALEESKSKVYVENTTDRNSNSITINNGLRNAKPTLNSQKGSIELFFESMAQTVLNLPMEVQADLKMQICKIVTNAEVKYCGYSPTRFKHE